jgi:hypothetical protein
VHIFDHTGSRAGVSGTGVIEAAAGKQITATAPVGMLDPVAAESFLLKRLSHHWKLPYLAFVSF